MNLDELKLIVDLIGNLGTQGKEAFIWWLVFDNVPWFLIWCGIISAIVYIVKKCVSLGEQSNHDEFFVEMRDTLKTGSSGSLFVSETIATKAKLRELALRYVDDKALRK